MNRIGVTLLEDALTLTLIATVLDVKNSLRFQR